MFLVAEVRGQTSKTRIPLCDTVEFESLLGGNKKDDQMVVFFLGGEGEIRTLGTIADTTVFKTVPLNHSGTSPIETIITDTELLVESLASDCRYPNMARTRHP